METITTTFAYIGLWFVIGAVVHTVKYHHTCSWGYLLGAAAAAFALAYIFSEIRRMRK